MAQFDIASQFSPTDWTGTQQSLSVFAKQNTGQNSGNMKQRITEKRIIESMYQIPGLVSARLQY
jgi:hypothetical protein